MARFIHENERLAVMRDEKRRESYAAYIGALYQESTLWDTRNRTWTLVEGLLLDVVLDNPCRAYGNDWYHGHCDNDDLCPMCKDIMFDLLQVVECARTVHSDLLKERGLHWNPLGEHVHLSSAYTADFLGAYIAQNADYIDEMHQLAMKDFSLQPEDM